ncbi:hypothetical protein L3Q82_005181 [Scortum barcoo]|uniref:Uncharacterized protein n=1 Tax=Scortum barcoo TaxID=214431 RepID=A0ACB8VAC5_9TELE|nr:hypothetical protein L3Q82_005181 [Scortum barcoo]
MAQRHQSGACENQRWALTPGICSRSWADRGMRFPEIWITDQSEKKTLGVTATAGEWANVLMMPFYPTLTSCKELTSPRGTQPGDLQAPGDSRQEPQATPPKPKPAAGPRTGEHLPDEEYRKLTPEQKKALREVRQATTGGQKKLAKQSQGKTAFTHKGKAYVWQRLPQGYKNSPNVFQSAVMDVLKDLGATIYIDDVFIAWMTQKKNTWRNCKRWIKRLTEAGLKLNLKKCQFGQFEVTYLGFQVAADLGLSEGYKEKLEQITPPKSENDLQKILGLCNYVRDHVPHYQKYAKPLYACLKKKKGRP